MKHSQLDAMMAESGLAPEKANELADLFSPLAAFSDEAPAPSTELNLLFGGGSPGASWREERPARLRRRSHRSRGTFAGVVVLALSGVGATGLSAAANALPSAWQHQVAGFSHHYLPFDFPEPPARQARRSSRAPDARHLVPRGADARRDAPNEATRSGTRTPYVVKSDPSGRDTGPRSASGTPDDQADWASGHSSSPLGPVTEDESSTAPGSHASAGDGAGEQREHGNHEGSGSGHSARPKKDTDEDESGSKDGDKQENADRPVKGGGIGAPKDLGKGKPGGGSGHGESGKDRSGDDTGEGREDSPTGGQENAGQGAPSQSDAGDRGKAGDDAGPSERTAPGPVGDSLSRLAPAADALLPGDAPSPDRRMNCRGTGTSRR